MELLEKMSIPDLRKTASNSNLFLFAALLFSLFDFYFVEWGGRILDYLGLILIFVLIFRMVSAAGIASLIPEGEWKIISIFVLPGIVIGLLNGNTLTAGAFTLGLLAVRPACNLVSPSSIRRTLHLLALTHLVAFFFQSLMFKMSGLLMDITGLVGAIPSRIYIAKTDYFRASGFFQEPNSYCQMAIFLSIALKSSQKRDILSDILSLLLSVTMFLSESLWGMAAAFIIPFLTARTWEGRIASIILGSLVLFCALYYQAPLQPFLQKRTLYRFEYLRQDPSLSERYFARQQVSSVKTTKEISTLIEKAVTWSIGRGLSTHRFQQFGANAYAFLFYSFGILGGCGLTYGFSKTLKNRKWPIIFSLLFSLTAYPIMTYCFWWLWIGMVEKLSNES